jgi:hypothetical protein
LIMFSFLFLKPQICERFFFVLWCFPKVSILWGETNLVPPHVAPPTVPLEFISELLKSARCCKETECGFEPNFSAGRHLVPYQCANRLPRLLMIHHIFLEQSRLLYLWAIMSTNEPSCLSINHHVSLWAIASVYEPSQLPRATHIFSEVTFGCPPIRHLPQITTPPCLPVSSHLSLIRPTTVRPTTSP